MSDDLARQGRSVGRDLNNGFPVNSERCHIIEQMAARIEELEAELAKAVEALGVLADDTNWFDAIEEDGTLSPAWRGTGTPDEIARTTLAELTGGKDE